MYNIVRRNGRSGADQEIQNGRVGTNGTPGVILGKHTVTMQFPIERPIRYVRWPLGSGRLELVPEAPRERCGFGETPKMLEIGVARTGDGLIDSPSSDCHLARS